MEIYYLKLNIEKKRIELASLISNKKLTDYKVVCCSEELDNLIAQYQKLVYLQKFIA